MKRSENIGVWKLVCAYAKAGSLKAASDAMELDPAAASRLISELETELGVALIDRSRKPAVPTEALTAIPPLRPADREGRAQHSLAHPGSEKDAGFRTRDPGECPVQYEPQLLS